MPSLNKHLYNEITGLCAYEGLTYSQVADDFNKKNHPGINPVARSPVRKPLKKFLNCVWPEM
jgi:hypothetical protein